MFHDLQAPIEHEEETKKVLENDMWFNSGVEQETTKIFQELLNEACSEQYPYCVKIFSMNFWLSWYMLRFSTVGVISHLTCY